MIGTIIIGYKYFHRRHFLVILGDQLTFSSNDIDGFP